MATKGFAALDTLTSAQVEEFAKSLSRVMAKLQNEVLNVIATGKTGNTYNAAIILDSRPQLLQALRDAGYQDLAEQHIAAYPDIVSKTREAFALQELPPPKFTQPNIETFQQIARADLDQFEFIGAKAMDEMRFVLYRQAIASQPFSDIVETIRAATVGTAKNGSPLSNYAYTHANTATLSFNGDVLRVAGESIGAKKWEVLGPLDDKTREICERALDKNIQTAEEWQDMGYWGGAPGGWNCRHQLWPVVDDAKAVDDANLGAIKTTSDAERVIRAAGVKNVSLKGLGAEQSRGVAMAVQRGGVEGIDTIETFRKKSMPGAAYYSPSNRKISINLAHKDQIGAGGVKVLKERLDLNKERLTKWEEYLNSAANNKQKGLARRNISAIQQSNRKLTSLIDAGHEKLPYSTTSLAKDKTQAYDLLVSHEIGHHMHEVGKIKTVNNLPANAVSEYSLVNAGEATAENYAVAVVFGSGAISKTALKLLGL